MTSRSLKSLRTTPRNTLRTICSARQLLGIAILVGGAAVTDAQAGNPLAKSSALQKPSPASTPRASSVTRRPQSSTIAQADDPLERLRQRNAEQRFRNALKEQEASSVAPGRESIPTPDAPSD